MDGPQNSLSSHMVQRDLVCMLTSGGGWWGLPPQSSCSRPFRHNLWETPLWVWEPCKGRRASPARPSSTFPQHVPWPVCTDTRPGACHAQHCTVCWLWLPAWTKCLEHPHKPLLYSVLHLVWGILLPKIKQTRGNKSGDYPKGPVTCRKWPHSSCSCQVPTSPPRARDSR